MSSPPIILIGMHRSGTTLVTKLLEDLGVYAGRRGGSNHEAKLFKHANKWAFHQLSATWDRPDNAAFLAAPEFRQHAERVFRAQTRGFRTAFYLGARKAARYRDLARLDFRWAWKDPRNSFTVGLWKRIFPAAKVVHVYRHPLDVAGSLLRREEARLDRYTRSLNTRVKEMLLVREQRSCHSFRLLDPLEGVELWQQYVEASFAGCVPFERDAIHCRYERLLADPEETLGEIADFLELETDADRIRSAVERVNPARAYAHEADSTLASLADEISTLALVKKLDYGRRQALVAAGGRTDRV